MAPKTSVNKKLTPTAKPAKKAAKQRVTDYSGLLTPCTREYTKLLANPYKRSHSACIPSLPATSSRKFSTYTSGVFQSPVNPSNNGFVSFNPWVSVNSDAECVVATSTTSTSVSFPDIGTIGSLNFLSNSEYNQAVLTALKPDLRLVAAGLRVKYNGALQTTGGRLLGLSEPDNIGLNSPYVYPIGTASAMTYAKMAGFPESEQIDLGSGPWYCVEYKPVNHFELQYNPINDGSNPDGTNNPVSRAAQLFRNGNCLGFALSPATAASSFVFEAFAHFEIVGYGIQSRTRSETDVLGLTASQTLFSDQRLRKPHMILNELQAERRASWLENLTGLTMGQFLRPLARYAFDSLPSVSSVVSNYLTGGSNSSSLLFNSMSGSARRLAFENVHSRM